MTPEDRTAINRTNAQKSTGPKSPAGKRRSSLNATRHGLTGQVVVLPADDLHAYSTFVASFHADLAPQGAMETQFVQVIADNSWTMNRHHANENNRLTMLAQQHLDSIQTRHPKIQNALATAEAAASQSKALANTALYLSRIQRVIERNLTLLRELQAERRTREAAEMRNAIALLKMHQEQGRQAKQSTPYDPQADGFVFSLAQIEARVHRETRNAEARPFSQRAA